MINRRESESTQRERLLLSWRPVIPAKTNMKIVSLTKVVFLCLLAVPLVAPAQTVIFKDAFTASQLSTLNGTSTPGGTPSASSTSYDVASTKTGTCSITAGSPGYLRMKLGGNTTAGYVELQALFAGTPVQLVNVGDSINLTVSFTNSAGTLLAGGNGSVIDVGLYNSGGTAPVAGALNSGGLGSATTYVSGNCQNWQGYVAQINYNGQSSSVYTRPMQIGASPNNGVQDLLFSGAGTGLYKFPTGTQIGSTLTSAATLTSGAKYTLSFTALLSAPGTITIINNLYTGGDTSGTLISAQTNTTSGGTTYTNYANLYDGLAIGIANKGTGMNPQMDISQITVSTNYYFSPTVTGLTNQTVVAGNNLTLSPAVTGNPTPAYQWYFSTDGGVTSNAIAGATGALLTLTNVQYSQNNYEYSLVATNSLGANSATMTLAVIVTPSITGLNNQAALVGDTVTISPTVSGVPAPALQWQTNGVNVADGPDANGSIIAGSTTSTLNITNVQLADGVTYSLVASNSAGIVTNSMNLTVATTYILPVITGPTNITVIQGNNGTFNASAAAVPLPTLQWLDQTQTPIPGATNNALTLTNVQYSQNGYTYYIVASNSVGSVTNGAILTVIVPPVITSQPTSLVVTNTQSASFTVVATGVPAPAYQWYKDGSPISSATNVTATSATFTIASAAPGDMSANYSCVITNQAGATNTVSVSLIVNSIMSAVAFAPANGQTGVSYDTPLYLTFSQPPVLRTNGTIKIFNVTNSSTPVDTINLAQNSTLGVQAHSLFSGDSQTFYYYPVIVTGSTAAIYPHSGVMTSNQTYYVTIDNGAFADTNGAYFAGIAATNVWQFSTKAGGPANPTNLVVAQDYSGDFVTVQGAVDSVPVGNTTPRMINIRNGTYTEIVDISGKHNLLLRGQSRAGTIIGYANNSTINASTHSRMAFKVNANDIALDNLTVTNSTAQDFSQAEALMVESGAARLIVNNCSVDSYQDTILANISTSKAYFNDSLVQGDVDFIWGGGNLFFTNCEIRYLIRAANSAALGPNPSPNASTDISSNGFSFVNCAFTTLPGANPNDTIGRTRSITNGNTALINCFISTNIGGWASDALPVGNFRNWYYGCTNDLGASVTLSNGIALSGGDPNVLLAGSAIAWLYGWQPQLSPNIVANPANVAASTGQRVSFAVTATGIPDPTYQWFQAGTNLPAATNATLLIPAAQAGNGGNYYVVVSNGSGSVTSSVANLAYSVVVPVAGPNFTMGAVMGLPATVQIVGGKYSPTDANNNPLTITSVAGATNGTVATGGTNVTYTATNGTGDAFTYTVSDGFGGTASATVTVVISSNVQGYNQLSAVSLGDGTDVLTFAGIPTYFYALDLATNLTPPINWMPQATNPAANNGLLIFTNVSAAPQSFYRTRYVP